MRMHSFLGMRSRDSTTVTPSFTSPKCRQPGYWTLRFDHDASTSRSSTEWRPSGAQSNMRRHFRSERRRCETQFFLPLDPPWLAPLTAIVLHTSRAGTRGTHSESYTGETGGPHYPSSGQGQPPVDDSLYVA